MYVISKHVKCFMEETQFLATLYKNESCYTKIFLEHYCSSLS